LDDVDEMDSIRAQMIGLGLCDPTINIEWDTPPEQVAEVAGDSFVLLGGLTNAQVPVVEDTSNLEQELLSYGFTNQPLNKKLISIFAGDVNAIIDCLTSDAGCKWLYE
jgi:hypothetical protein